LTIANPTIPSVPFPAGVEHVSEWNDAAPTPYRILHGPNRGVEGHDLVVWTTASQSAYGCIDVDEEPPTIRIDIAWERSLTGAQARELAACGSRWSCSTVTFTSGVNGPPGAASTPSGSAV
jgi:hypothetical protein